jgi:hypothetical protein
MTGVGGLAMSSVCCVANIVVMVCVWMTVISPRAIISISLQWTATDVTRNVSILALAREMMSAMIVKM